MNTEARVEARVEARTTLDHVALGLYHSISASTGKARDRNIVVLKGVADVADQLEELLASMVDGGSIEVGVAKQIIASLYAMEGGGLKRRYIHELADAFR